MSADQTQAQMNPGIAGLNAFFANMRGRFFDFDLDRGGCTLRTSLPPGWSQFVFGQVTTVM
jgi:hypothetical protein